MGPSANTDICPEYGKVGQFKGNHAHSNGRYGLRIFHKMIPKKYQCKPITYDHDKPDDPYHANPPITANFHDFTSWKNGRNGAICEESGDVRFHNFKTADNILAGIEFGITDHYGDDTTRIDGALIIGKSSNTNIRLDAASPHGILTARTENFMVKNAKFYNFNWNDAAAIGSCSHCMNDGSTDSGARTVKFSGLKFDDATVTKRIKF